MPLWLWQGPACLDAFSPSGSDDLTTLAGSKQHIKWLNWLPSRHWLRTLTYGATQMSILHIFSISNMLQLSVTLKHEAPQSQIIFIHDLSLCVMTNCLQINRGKQYYLFYCVSLCCYHFIILLHLCFDYLMLSNMKHQYQSIRFCDLFNYH